MHLLEFIVEGRRCAIPVAAAERIHLAVEVTPLANAPDAVQGLVNVEGRILPVISLRRRLGLPDRDPLPGDRMIVAHTSRRSMVLLVDAVPGVLDVDETAYVSGEALFPDAGSLLGVSQVEGDLLMVEDLEQLLAAEDEPILAAALENPPHAAPDAA
ncbi:MAG: chemotaxis protein CheW [Thermodesulfobacteriota bacterium]